MSRGAAELLSSRHPDLRIKPDSVSIREGWLPLVDDLMSELGRIAQESGTPIHVQRIKQKMGGLRVYAYPCSPEVDGAIRAAETKAARTCEVCGNPSSIQNVGGWLTTSCPRCLHALASLRRQVADRSE